MPNTSTPRAARVPLPNIYAALLKERGAALAAATIEANKASDAVAEVLAAGSPR